LIGVFLTAIFERFAGLSLRGGAAVSAVTATRLDS
jgi:hypothetical protein